MLKILVTNNIILLLRINKNSTVNVIKNKNIWFGTDNIQSLECETQTHHNEINVGFKNRMWQLAFKSMHFLVV
jgi:hypothetical protein